MKKFFSSWMLAVLLALTALSLSACAADKKPEAVVEQFYRAAFDDKTDEAINYVALGDVKENDMTATKGKIQMMVGGMSSKAKEWGGLQSIKTTVLEQEETYAKVETELTFKNDEIREHVEKLVKEDGKWKIILE
ncbi:DUF4878 domain-containing protein [Stenoxybacter acetivorans]|uniref:DUF4878 domain-containing protein n=1 Tax=Stenoxybacter acetivorans TaxID=422441 RepID=UPI00055C43F3|nr:DUF4878 domain-containing protein [Stenoxybacter acetivorans]